MAILKDKDGNEVEVSSKEELATELDKAVSKHLTGALRSQLPKLLASDEVATTISSKLGIDEKLTSFGEALIEKLKAEPPKPPDEKGKSNHQEPKLEDTPAYRAMQKQLEETKNRLDAAEAAKKAERDKARAQALRQKSTEALTEAGVTGAGTRHAFNSLLADGRIKWEGDDSEELLFVDSKGDELPLADGVKSWVESDDAKMFLPPRGASGSGDPPRRGPGTKHQQNPFEYDPNVLGAALRELGD
jgi:hypothetical protein